ncbi:MAG: hypothetical protein AAFX03_00740 [Pseudomonadota bacterium]
MRRVLAGAAVSAALTAVPAAADLQNANLWIGLGNGVDGFLINEDTGEAWMTGVCLKSIAAVESTGSGWVSHTVETVSVGRGVTVLDQTFVLNPDPSAPSITVQNRTRGGVQTFPAVVEGDCQSSSACRARLNAPVC